MPARVFTSLSMLFLLMSGTAMADTIDVKLDQAKIIRIAAPAGTIIIGNPAIADATMQDAQTLIVTGHAYGTTNMIILDSEGETISEMDLVVGQPTANVVTVFRGALRGSMSCAPICQPTAVPGDSDAFFNSIVGQTAAHNGNAQGPAATAPTSMGGQGGGTGTQQ